MSTPVVISHGKTATVTGVRPPSRFGEPLERCAADGQLMKFPHHGFWQCMDTFRDLVRIEEHWNDGKPPWRTW